MQYITHNASYIIKHQVKFRGTGIFSESNKNKYPLQFSAEVLRNHTIDYLTLTPGSLTRLITVLSRIAAIPSGLLESKKSLSEDMTLLMMAQLFLKGGAYNLVAVYMYTS